MFDPSISDKLFVVGSHIPELWHPVDRVCHEVEGAHTWDIAGRGIDCEIVADMNQEWGSSESCTSCGKCVFVCPTGALIKKGETVAEMEKQTEFLKYIVTARQQKLWIHTEGEEE